MKSRVRDVEKNKARKTGGLIQPKWHGKGVDVNYDKKSSAGLYHYAEILVNAG